MEFVTLHQLVTVSVIAEIGIDVAQFINDAASIV